MNFISGEKIQFLCDHFIGNDRDFNYNPNVKKYKAKFIHNDSKTLSTQHLDNKPLIFCYTHLLSNINNLINTLKILDNPFKLVFHNSDGSFKIQHLVLFEKLPLLQSIYTQNMDVVHERVFPLPIGFANAQWPHGNQKIYQEVYYMSIEKTKDIYFNFSLHTNRQKRNICYREIKNKGIEWSNNRPYREYLIELRKHKFAICPEGNGLDTHRFWECLYMDVMPICKRNTVTEYYSKLFPVILLNEWKDLDVQELQYTVNKNKDLLDLKIIL